MYLLMNNHENMLWIDDWKLTYVTCHVEILVRYTELYEEINANCGGAGRLQAAPGAHSGRFKVRTLQTLGVQTYLIGFSYTNIPCRH